MIWLGVLLAHASDESDVTTWFRDAGIVVRGEVTSAQYVEPGAIFTRTRYQIQVLETYKGQVTSGLLVFTGPGGGFGGSTNDFTLGYQEEVVVFVSRTSDDGQFEYETSTVRMLSRFVGTEGNSLVSEVVTGNTRRPLAPTCITGDLQSPAPEPVSAKLPGLDSNQRSVRRVHELSLEEGCGWMAFLDVLREPRASGGISAQTITGAAPLQPDPSLTDLSWYDHRERMRARFGSAPVAKEVP
jgi:hypothetical protein